MTGWSPSEDAIEAAAEFLTYGHQWTRRIIAAEILRAAYAVDMPAEGERIATAIEAHCETGNHAPPGLKCGVCPDYALIARTPPEETS